MAWKATEALWLRIEADLTGIKFDNSASGYSNNAGAQLFSAGISYRF